MVLITSSNFLLLLVFKEINLFISDIMFSSFFIVGFISFFVKSWIILSSCVFISVNVSLLFEDIILVIIVIGEFLG